jgi:hypothetical protein
MTTSRLRGVKKQPVTPRSTRLYVALTLIVLLGRFGSGVAQARTDTASERAKTPLEEVVVTAKRHLTDEQVTQQVEKALADDPYAYAEHVTVTTSNGVVTCEGIVGDAAELRRGCASVDGLQDRSAWLVNLKSTTTHGRGASGSRAPAVIRMEACSCRYG